MSASYAMYCDLHGKHFDRRVSYDEDTPFDVIEALENCRRNHKHVRLFFGDQDTGVAWAEEFACYGRIGLTTGEIKAPILCHPSSNGGHIILSKNVVGVLVNFQSRKMWVYKHPKLTIGEWSIRHWPHGEHGETFPWEVLHNSKVYARVKTETRAKRLVAYMTGDRIAP